MSASAGPDLSLDTTENFLGIDFTPQAVNGGWTIGVLLLLMLLGVCSAFCVIYSMCFATTEGHALGRFKSSGGSGNKVSPGDAKDKATKDCYEALHPYFKEKPGGRTLKDKEFHDPDLKNANSGLSENRLVKGNYAKPEALNLLTRGITALQMMDPNGVYRAGADDLNKDPMHYFNQSVPTTRIKAFISHSWDRKEFNAQTVEQDRKEHAENTTKAIMYHVKSRAMFVSSLIGILVNCIAVVGAAMPGAFFSILFYLGMPIWIAGSKSPLLMRFLGLVGPQFWMDKATIHQANLKAGGEPEGSQPLPPSGFKFLAPNELDKMSEQQKANQTSEYRVLNQAGVSLFDHFLTQSDELWVLFIERYVNRVWCVYELAYWLRLMKKDKRRKIKLIPVDRNARLFRGLPTFQYVSTVFLILYAGGIGLACTMYNKACDPNDPTMPAHSRQYCLYSSDGSTIAIVLFWLVVTAVIMVCLVVCMSNRYIKPSKAERNRVIRGLQNFSVYDTDASFPGDKELVLGMIATMWRDSAGGAKASDADALKAFDEEIRSEVAPFLNKLLEKTEHDLLRQYVISCVVLKLTALIYIGYAIDVWRPVAMPRFAFWGSRNLQPFMGLIAVALVLMCCMSCVIFQWANRAWKK